MPASFRGLTADEAVILGPAKSVQNSSDFSMKLNSVNELLECLTPLKSIIDRPCMFGWSIFNKLKRTLGVLTFLNSHLECTEAVCGSSPYKNAYRLNN